MRGNVIASYAFGLILIIDVKCNDTLGATDNAFVKHYFIVCKTSCGYLTEIYLVKSAAKKHFVLIFCELFYITRESSAEYVKLASCECRDVSYVFDTDEKGVGVAYNHLLCKWSYVGIFGAYIKGFLSLVNTA